jgi:2-oxoglutarate dehydrogenase E1 component
MGAVSFLMMNLVSFPIDYISRPAGASTATGFSKKHAKEQLDLVDRAFVL